MLNREYHKRATRQGIAQRTLAQRGGGHQVAADAALRLPWAGIFEPWRPLVLVAAAQQDVQRNAIQKTAKRCKKSAQRLLFDGKLRGVQLALFPENEMQNADPGQKQRELPADSKFPPLARMLDPLTEDELAAEFEKLFT